MTQLIIDRMNQICLEELSGSLKKIDTEDEPPTTQEVLPPVLEPTAVVEPMLDLGGRPGRIAEYG